MNHRPVFHAVIFVVIGLFTTALLLVGKRVFEQTDGGHRLESYGYEILQSYLPPFVPREDMPVVVVDIGQLEGGKDKYITPRERLKEIIGAIAKENPKAIALDIDFSPEENGGWQDQNDPEFFDYCLGLRRSGTPVFLGVDRSIKSPPESWLGLEKYKTLAVGMRFQFPDTTRVILWTKPANTSERIPSISLALTKSYQGSLSKPPAVLISMLEPVEDYDQKTEELHDSEVASTKALVNFSTLEAIESQSLKTTSAGSVAEEGSRFRDKLVLLGRMTDTDDRHLVLGRKTAIPGVLLHASATYTFVKSPLFEFSYKARILLDVMLSFFILVFVAMIRYRNREKADYDWHQREWLALIAMIALVFAAGITLVRWIEVIWFDFLVVIIALLFHPVLERRIGARLYRKRIQRPPTVLDRNE